MRRRKTDWKKLAARYKASFARRTALLELERKRQESMPKLEAPPKAPKRKFKVKLKSA